MAPHVIIKDDMGRIGDPQGLEDRLRKTGYRRVVGVDEAGRGPLAGPVVAAAVMLPEDLHMEGLDDSKKLSPAKRNLVFDRIVSSDAVCAVGVVDNEIIDRINILRASLQAMARAVNKLECIPDLVIVDGKMTISGINLPQMAIIGGDGTCPSIAAASILAKVTRDRIMDHYAELYPLYSFGRHKGYPTAEHLKELRVYGPTPIHRKSFRPVQEAVSRLNLQLAG
jgi:ribonuclease HII